MHVCANPSLNLTEKSRTFSYYFQWKDKIFSQNAKKKKKKEVETERIIFNSMIFFLPSLTLEKLFIHI